MNWHRENLKLYHKNNRLNGEHNQVIRRSITVDDENNKKINEIRASYLKANLELDFTRAVNMLIALATHYLSKEPKTLPSDVSKIIETYFRGSQDLELAATQDEEWTKWLQYEFPKLTKRIQELDRQTAAETKKDAQRREGAVQTEK